MARTNTVRQALASQAANRLKVVATHVKPFAGSTRAAATRGVRATGRWGAPKVERTGQVLQDRVAPKVASLLSSAAHRLDPGKPRVARWRRPAGIATVTAAASAAVAVVFRRRKSATASSPAGQGGLAPTAGTGDMGAATSADSDGQERSS